MNYKSWHRVKVKEFQFFLSLWKMDINKFISMNHILKTRVGHFFLQYVHHKIFLWRVIECKCNWKSYNRYTDMLRCNRWSYDYKSYKISLIADFCRLLDKTVINAQLPEYYYPLPNVSGYTRDAFVLYSVLFYFKIIY